MQTTFLVFIAVMKGRFQRRAARSNCTMPSERRCRYFKLWALRRVTGLFAFTKTCTPGLGSQQPMTWLALWIGRLRCAWPMLQENFLMSRFLTACFMRAWKALCRAARTWQNAMCGGCKTGREIFCARSARQASASGQPIRPARQVSASGRGEGRPCMAHIGVGGRRIRNALLKRNACAHIA